MKTLQYFPGCCCSFGFNDAYYKSAIALGRKIGYELDEIEDWNCCGATYYKSISEEKAILASARNLAITEKKSNELTVTCSACFAVISKAAQRYGESPDLRSIMDGALREAGLVYEGRVKVRHLLEVVFNDFKVSDLASKVVRPLKGLRIAPYYGCLILRPVPAKIPGDALEQLVRLSGAEPIDFSGRDRCCGGMLMFNRPDVGLQLVRNLLTEVLMKGSDLIITTCPLCQTNLEIYQGAVNKNFGTDFHIPVIYFTQMLGYSMGVEPEELGLGGELIKSVPVLERVSKK